ncbi:14878_t:CDS:2 [Rhizophagus irregularis]|nr:14878_t:CDS:2 [Rhizophagus irregularis]
MLVHALPSHEDQSFRLVKRCNFFKRLISGCGEQKLNEDCSTQECADGNISLRINFWEFLKIDNEASLDNDIFGFPTTRGKMFTKIKIRWKVKGRTVRLSLLSYNLVLLNEIFL